MDFPKLEQKNLPKPPRLRHAIGVGIVITGLAMGTGELIIWPHLIVKNGLSILWLAMFGILAQVFLNIEISRYAIATGESFFTSSARIFKRIPFFWLIAALILYMWPGWASATGTILNALFGVGGHIFWGWFSLLLVFVLTFTGKYAYDILEKILKISVPIFFILLVIISFKNISPSLFVEALKGVVSFGIIPVGVDMQTLFGAIVFAGAGGMLNLCVSLWYRDKNFGMGAYAAKITNPITGKPEAVSPAGFTFNPSLDENFVNWKSWLKFMRIDQVVIFGFFGFLTLFLLSVNAYAVLSVSGHIPEGLNVATYQAEIFSESWGVVGAKLYLIMAFLMLFSVMWTVIDALSRIISDIVHTNAKIGPNVQYFKMFSRFSIHHLYYLCVSIVILIGAVLLPFNQPLNWLVLAGVLGGAVMFIYTPLILFLNNFRLDKKLRPSFITNAFLIVITLFYGYFSCQAFLHWIN